jgi:hypothetical protein
MLCMPMENYPDLDAVVVNVFHTFTFYMMV